MFGITFHDQLFGSWDQAKGYLVEELQQLHAVLDRRVGSFLANTSPGAIVIGSPSGNEWTALPIGAADTVLRSDGTAPSWQKVVLSTDVTGILGVTHGGTGLATYAIGDLIYASTTAVLSRLADVATGNALISGGVGVAPLWGKIGLTTHVSGTLPIGNGGTNSASALSGSTIMISNGSAIVQGTAGTTTTVLHGNASGAPTYGAVNLTTDVTGDLPFSSFVQASAASRLVGRGSASGAGDFEEITLGTGLTMTGTVLSSSSSSSLEVKEIDGAPDVTPVTIIRVSNGTLTDDGGGQVTINTAGSGSTPHDLLDGVQNQDTVAQTVSRGSLIYGNTTPKWDELVIGSANTVLRTDGTDAAWGKVALSTDVSGDLPYANLTPSANASRLLGRESGSAGDWEEISLGASLTMSSTTLSVASGIAAHALLDGTVNNDTLAAGPTRGDIIVANATPKWARKAVGAVNTVLVSDGTDPAWDPSPRVDTIYYEGRIIPADIGADKNDYLPIDSGSSQSFHDVMHISVAASAAYNITGFDEGATGEPKIFTNRGTFDITFVHASTLSSVNNRIWCPNATNYVVKPKASVQIYYSQPDNKWVVVDNAATAGQTFIRGITIDGAGSVISTGLKGFLSIPVTCTLVRWRIMADVPGAVVIDVWRDVYSNFPPDNSDSITNGNEPTITATNQSAESTSLGGWTSTAIVAGDVLAFNVDSRTTVTRVTLELTFTT